MSPDSAPTADARRDILAAVRRAAVPERARSAESLETPAYLMSASDDVSCIDLFVDRLLDYRATVSNVVGELEQPAALVAAIAAALHALGISRAVVPSGFPHEWRPDGLTVLDGDDLDIASLAAMPATITSSAAAVASTGTIMLDHGPDQGPRRLSLLPDVHVCLVHVDDIHGELPEAIRSMPFAPTMTWISGPSATSDIELVRVEGVHGPRTLVVVIHDAERPAQSTG
jgi:L-lactate utilization protein LutC